MRKCYDITIKFSDVSNNQLSENNFNLREKGYWVCQTKNWQITEKDVPNTGINIPDRSDAIDLQDKKIYRFPDLDLPRQKVDLIKDKYNCRVIRDKDKADVWIISVKYLTRILSTSWNSYYPFQYTYEFLRWLKAENMLTATGLNQIRDYVGGITKDSLCRIDIGYAYSESQMGQDMHNKCAEQWDKIIKESQNPSITDTNGRDVLLEATSQDFKQRCENFGALLSGGKEVILDIQVSNLIDDELVTLEDSELDNIATMIKSDDRDNRALALEMLANCNVDKSWNVTSWIAYFYTHDYLKSCVKNWNTVNVKAWRKKMDKYINTGGYNNGISNYNQYLNLLAKDSKLTRFAVDKTRKLLYDKWMTNTLGANAQVFHVDFDNVKLKDQYEQQVIDE